MVGILRHHFEPAPNASQLCADMLHQALFAELMGWDGRNKQFVVHINITEDVQRDLDRFQFPLPMVVPPRLVRENEDTGYFTCKGSILLRKNHHTDDVCLDHINRVNRMRFRIDHVTARMIKNRWRNLDKPKEGESQDEFNKRVKAFDKYDRTSKEVIDKLLAHGNEFYLTHRYDKRGRIYCQGYHVNYQGAPWNKAVIELADREFVD
jgi:DNA-directed RNA polymerase